MLKTSISALALAAASFAPGAEAATAFLARSGAGSACSLASPCASMSSALAAAGANGEVICLDRGVYGGALISQSVTISCGDGFWETGGAFVTITLQTAAAAATIEGLVNDRQRAGPGNALSFNGQGALTLRRARLGNTGGNGSSGLLFAPTGPAALNVSDTVFYNETSGHGLLIQPTGAGSARAQIRTSRFERNFHGLFVNGSFISTAISVSLDGCAFTDNQNGVNAASAAGAAPVTISVKGSQITGNASAGLLSQGVGGTTIDVGSSLISGNATGLSTLNSGQIVSFGNNQLRSNTTNGAFTSTVALQ